MRLFSISILDTCRRTPPFSTTGSRTRQAFHWVCDWCECFESLDGFRYHKASVCKILVVISEKCPILPFILALSLAATTGCGADNQPPTLVRQADSLWTRKSGIDWPRMLGPNYDSRSSEVGILTKWPSAGLKVVWTADTGVSYGNGVAAT